jgi:allantoicase
MKDQSNVVPPYTKLTDLASERLGGYILSATDEWFAPASWLLRPGRGEFTPGKFVETGQVYEGWETRRHNKDHDHCIIRLGLKGVICGFDVDTNHFTGNNGEFASVDGAFLETEPRKDELVNIQWTEILPKSQLQNGEPGKGHNYFEIQNDKIWTHVRLHMYPDGGIARFRVFGKPHMDWEKFDSREIMNLAGIECGAGIADVSNAHYSHPGNMLQPGRGINMGDGWETRRRRGKGHDWAIVRLGASGFPNRLLIDTNHFKGNFPPLCSVEGTFIEEDSSLEDANWTEILREPLCAHKEHHFTIPEPHKFLLINHVRINVFPDGGVSRFRVYCQLASQQLRPTKMPKYGKMEGAIVAKLLNVGDYSNYGNVVDLQEDKGVTLSATTTRYNWLTDMQNLRPNAKLNLCCFKVKATVLPFQIKLLERHLFSTQVFLPRKDTRYLAIVAQNGKDDKPDLSTLRAFIAEKGQGITYFPGTWHHPIACLDFDLSFNCMVYEDGNPDDCHIVKYEDPIYVINELNL